MTATRGPIPKRTTERRRRNKPEVPVVRLPHGDAHELGWPEPGEWEPFIVRLYRSLSVSPMARDYFQTDVEQAWAVMEFGHRMFNGAGTHSGRGVSGQSFAAWLSALAELGTTEGARRRLRIEIERGEPENAEKDRIMGGYLKVLRKSS